VDRLRTLLFVLSGTAAVFAGLAQSARFGSVDATRGTGLELQVVAAIVIGGTRITGGYGSVIGTALGCLTVAMIDNGMALLGLAGYWSQAGIGLLGDNGAGKSTLIRMLSGLIQPDAGEITWDGRRIQMHSPRDAYDLGIATVYQELALVDTMSIYRNMFLGRERSVSRGRWPLRWIDRKRARQESRRTIAELGIDIRSADEPVAELSGGQRQSIAIARAVHFSARLMILDEPVSALSVRQTESVLRTIESARERGLSIIVISHNVHHVDRVADRIVVLSHGESVASFRRGEVGAEDVSDLIVRGREAAHRLGLDS
jgi:simple sugar transport system ATP-binding protein